MTTARRHAATGPTTAAARLALAAAGLGLALAPPLAAQGWDLTLYLGQSFPTFEQSFLFQPPGGAPAPGVGVEPAGPLRLDAKGALAFGGALGYEFAGFLGLEGRVDTTTIDLQGTGTEIALTAQLPPPIGSRRATLTIGDAAIELDRLFVLSLNLRLHTPGAVQLVASGGVSYLSSLSATGAVPLTLQIEGVGALPDLFGRVRLEALPSQDQNRFGLNAGAGLRVRLGERVALLAEGRAFVFREYELGFEITSDPQVPGLDEILAQIEPVRFEPVFFHVAAGLVVSF